MVNYSKRHFYLYKNFKFLIKGGVDVNIPNNLKEYPLQLAIQFNKKDAAKSMLNQKKIFLNTFEATGYNPLIDAAEKDLTEISVLLIENGADLNVCDKEQLWTPLMHAITNSNEILVEKLLTHKCGVNNVDADGNTPLHLAVQSGNEFLIKSLLKASPNKTIRNKQNQTPADIACALEDETAIKLLS